MATTAQYTAQPIIECTSTTSSSATTIAAALSTAAANGVGKRIMRVYSTVTTTNTAGKIGLYLTVSSTDFLIAERAVAANTVNNTSAALRVEFPEASGLVMPGGSTTSLKLSHTINATVNTTVESGLL